MQRLSVSEVTTRDWTFFDDVRQYAAYGINSIGVWRNKIEYTDFECEPKLDYEIVAAHLQDMRMNVSSLTWAGGFTGSCGQTFCDAIDDARTAIYNAYMIGAGCLIIYPGAANGHTKNHALSNIRAALQTLLPYAKDLGIRLGIEPISTRKNPWSFIGNFQDHLDFVRSFNDQQLGLVLDLYHVGQNRRLLHTLEDIKDEIALVQLADTKAANPIDKEKSGAFLDNARCLLGEGNIMIQQWLKKLSEIEYRGEFEIELHGELLSDVDSNERLRHTCDYLLEIPVAAELLKA